MYKVPTNSREIDALNKEIAGVQKDIADRQNRNREVTSAQYSVQANNYQKLFNLTKDKKELSNAIDSITKALAKSPEAQYLAKRAELYSKNEEFEKAARDISKLSELGPIAGIAGIYVNKVVKDIATLNEIQDQISLLSTNGEISQELAAILSDHAKITQNLVLKVGVHDERLDGHDEQIEVLKDQLKKSQYQITQAMLLIAQGETLTKEQIKELQRGQEEGEKKLVIVERKVDDLKLKVETVEDRVDNVEDKVVALQDASSMIEVCVQSLNANAGTHQIIESINYLKSKQDYLSGLITNQDAFGIDLKIRIAELTKSSDPKLLESICKQVAEHEKILEESGTKAKAEIRECLKMLETEDPKLLFYFKTFYWTTLNLFDAFRVLSTDYVAKNTNAVFSKKAGGAILAEEQAFKLGAELTNGIPVVGTIMSLLNIVNQGAVYAVKYRAFVNQVNSINQIIFSSMLNEDEISINIAQAAIQIIEAKKAEILDPREKTITIGGKIEKLSSWIQSAIKSGESTILQMPYEVDLHENNPQVKLALEDVSFMMAYLYTHYEEKPSQLTEKMTEIILNHSAEIALEKILKDKTPDELKDLAEGYSGSSESEYKESEYSLKVDDEGIYINMLGRDAELIWKKAKSGSWSPLFTKGVSYFCKDVYLTELAIKNKVKPEEALEFKNKMKMVIFHLICDGANNSKNFDCAEKFAKKNPDLVHQMVYTNPEFFVTPNVAKVCISDPNILKDLIKSFESHSLSDHRETSLSSRAQFDDDDQLSLLGHQDLSGNQDE